MAFNLVKTDACLNFHLAYGPISAAAMIAGVLLERCPQIAMFAPRVRPTLV